MKTLLIAVAALVAGSAVAGSNIEAHFEREVPTVCKLETVGDTPATDEGVRGEGKLLFAGEEFTQDDAVKFRFETNTGNGQGYIQLKGTDADDEFDLYVKDSNQTPTLEEDGLEVGDFVTVNEGVISIYARLETEAIEHEAGTTVEAEAFLNATNGRNAPELDCGVNDFIYEPEVDEDEDDEEDDD